MKVATLITFNVSYRILDVADMLALIILTNIVIRCLTPVSIIIWYTKEGKEVRPG
jgi:hypothetical protein